MGDTIIPTHSRGVGTPEAGHFTRATSDPPAPSLDPAPSRCSSNNPAANGPESPNSGLGALQVVTSSGTTHDDDETWNSFLHVRPFPQSPHLPTSCLHSTICILQRSFAEGKASKVSRSPFPSPHVHRKSPHISGSPITTTLPLRLSDAYVHTYR